MTKNFDLICKGILGEMVTAPNPQKPTPTQPNQQQPNQTQPAQGTGAQAAVQNNNQQGQQPSQMNDDEVIKNLQQKMKQDPKIKEMLLQLLNPQQPNATNNQQG